MMAIALAAKEDVKIKIRIKNRLIINLIRYEEILSYLILSETIFTNLEYVFRNVHFEYLIR